jgi:hypothetical protein
MTTHDGTPGALGANEELLVQDVRIAIGEYESYCLRCLLLRSIPRLPFDAKKNELVAAFAKSRKVELPTVEPL